MRTWVFAILTSLILLAGCLEDDATDETAEPTEEPTEEPVEEPQVEDRGEYTFDPATGLCHAKEYTDVGDAGQVYESSLGGGTWGFAETNGVPGLQYEDNHPLSGTGAGEELPVDADCTNGDQVVF